MRLLACFVLSFVAVPLCAAQTIQINRENRTIAITATDSAEADSDTADVSIGFVSYGAEQDKTYGEASKTSNRIVDALLPSGIRREQIRSDTQNLTTLDLEDKPRYQQGIRFVFRQAWTVTANAREAAEVLHLAVSAGANESGAITWRLADDNALQAEAARKALTHGQQIAEQMAKGLHAELGSLVYASNEAPRRDFVGRFINTQTASLSSSKSTINLKPLAIVPDRVTRTATVYAVFAIQ